MFRLRMGDLVILVVYAAVSLGLMLAALRALGPAQAEVLFPTPSAICWLLAALSALIMSRRTSSGRGSGFLLTQDCICSPFYALAVAESHSCTRSHF